MSISLNSNVKAGQLNYPGSKRCFTPAGFTLVEIILVFF